MGPERCRAQATPAAQAVTESPSASANAVRVTYVTASAVYIDAGRDQGLSEGDTLDVFRDRRFVARLLVGALSSRQALCAPIAGFERVLANDAVILPGAPRDDSVTSAHAEGDAARQGAPADSARDGEHRGTPPPRERRPDAARQGSGRLRALGAEGRIGVRFTAVRDRSGAGRHLYQPALDVRLSGSDVADSPFGFAFDVRARRSYRPADDAQASSSGRARVYRLASSWRRGERGLQVTAGRQISPALAPVSVFDGILAESVGERWRGGAFAGYQPDPSTYHHSQRVREYGGYVQHDAPRTASLRTTLTAGAIGSYDRGEVNREFIFLHGRFSNARVAAHASQEIDFNRGWKADEEDHAVALTSAFASVRLHAREGLALTAGFDNRRNVRLYRDVITPETEFDDDYRRGIWGGCEIQAAELWRITLRSQTNSSGASEQATSYTVATSARGLTRARVGIGARGTRYDGDRISGWLWALDGDVALAPRLRLAVRGGLRDDRPSAMGIARRLVWLGAEFEAGLTRSLYAILSAERNESDFDRYDQLFTSLSYRL
jgi:hypothetical protein